MAWSRATVQTHPDILEIRARHERATTTPHAQLIEAAALLTGLYIAASPWIANFSDRRTLAVTNLIVGIAFALLLSGFGRAYERTHGMAWAAAALGVWTIIAPWVVAGQVATTRTIASNVVSGALALLLALAAGLMARTRTATGHVGVSPNQVTRP